MIKKNAALLAALCLLLLLPAGCGGPQDRPGVAETVNVWDKQADDVDILALGAVGDGVADDTAAFQEAVRQAQQQGGRLFLPAGTFLLSGAVTVPQDVCLVFGTGAGLLIKQTGALLLKGTLAADLRANIFQGTGQVHLATNEYWVSACWFGAKGDGQTDDTAAFERAFAVAREVRVPYTEAGYVIRELKTYRNWTLTGLEEDGKRPVLHATPKTYSLISVSDGNISDGGHATVRNIDFDMAAAPARSAAIYFDTASGWLYDIYVQHCTITDAYYSFYDSRQTTTAERQAIFYLHIDDVVCRDNRYSTFEIVDFEGYIFFKDMVIDNSNSYTKHGLTEPFPMINVSHLAGNILQNVTLIGGNTGDEREVAIYYPGCTSVWFDGLEIRNCGGYAMVLDSYITSVSNTVIQNCGGGIDATDSVQLQMNLVTINGRKDLPYQLPGLNLHSVNESQLTRVSSCGNAGSGLDCRNSTVVLTDCVFKDNDQYGITMPSGSRNQIIRCVCTGNKIAQVKARGGGMVVVDTVVTEGGQPLSDVDVFEY